MSGFGAPSRTTIPTSERASSILLAGRTTPRFASSSAAPPSRITTSAASPRASRVGIASGESPIDGPRVVMSLWPLAFSNPGPSSEYTLKKPAEIITWTSAADAVPASSAPTQSAAPHRITSLRWYSLAIRIRDCLGDVLVEKVSGLRLHRGADFVLLRHELVDVWRLTLLRRYRLQLLRREQRRIRRREVSIPLRLIPGRGSFQFLGYQGPS